MFLGYLLIFCARVLDVSMATMRTLLVVQGRKIHASVLGFVEMLIYILALNSVVGNLDNPINLFVYALGFAMGNYVGITIEGKIGLGKLSAQIILKTMGNEELIDILRENGFGVTVFEGKGIEGKKEIMLVALNRKSLQKLRSLVYEYDEGAFMTVNNINPIGGGYFTKAK